MLDVHPPEHAAHTWRDFFIHIATIVVGLLIAVGLEQLVEHVHQRYELRETREALQRELESNRARVASAERGWLGTTAGLKNNLLVLQYIRTHPGTPQTALPGTLDWIEGPFVYDHAVWDAAEKNGITRLMPLSESNRDQELYALLSILADQNLETWNALNDACRFDLLDTDPTHLSQQQLDQVLQLTEIALEKHIEEGYSYGRLAHEFPDMPQTITWININAIRPSAIDLDPKGLAAADQLTQNRIRAATANLPAQ
jgi:type II secretory pathway pseudopilin PulG